MINEHDARNKMIDLLQELGKRIKGGLVLLDNETIKKPYGWIFFYSSSLYIETRSLEHAIAGNGPVVILAATGEVVMLGTARAEEDEIAAFEQTRSLTPQ